MVDQETPCPVGCTDVNDMGQEPSGGAMGPSGAMKKPLEQEPFENDSDKVVEVVMIDHTPPVSVVDLLSDTNTDMGQELAESNSPDQQPRAEKADAALSVTPPASAIVDQSGLSCVSTSSAIDMLITLADAATEKATVDAMASEPTSLENLVAAVAAEAEHAERPPSPAKTIEFDAAEFDAAEFDDDTNGAQDAGDNTNDVHEPSSRETEDAGDKEEEQDGLEEPYNAAANDAQFQNALLEELLEEAKSESECRGFDMKSLDLLFYKQMVSAPPAKMREPHAFWRARASVTASANTTRQPSPPARAAA
eukprot:5275169-Pleurochrysis_carterae.AAC.1